MVIAIIALFFCDLPCCPHKLSNHPIFLIHFDLLTSGLLLLDSILNLVILYCGFDKEGYSGDNNAASIGKVSNSLDLINVPLKLYLTSDESSAITLFSGFSCQV